MDGLITPPAKISENNLPRICLCNVGGVAMLEGWLRQNYVITKTLIPQE